MVEKVNEPKYASLPPSKIVPMLADEDIYITSESTFYRVLRELQMNVVRGASKPRNMELPTTHIASNPNEVWSWDITWLHRADVRGLYYKLYMILDIYSRKIGGYEVWETENATYSEMLVRKASYYTLITAVR